MADRYRVERELGRGGMATVYLARDLRHDRPVALKVLHAELANTLGPERFQREIQLVARLQHPHILTVLDSGETAVPGGARLWFTMPFVEGESLRDRLRRERQLPVDDAVRIAREAAQALQYAHRHGVVHRDIKPENILLTSDGDTLVADFGIARALEAGGGQERLTETGLTLGTPAYMSPEQASGGRELDARTDIYSLGTVLYEMLAGEPPFTGATPQALLARRVLEDAPPLRQHRPSAPESLERAVATALARTPADRFASAGDFARALEAGDASRPATSSVTASAAPPVSTPARLQRRVPAALAFVLGLLVTATMGMLIWQRTHRAPPAGADGSRVVAVLPFENLGGADQEYFADGVTDAIRGKLAAIPGLQVIARSSSRPYKGSGKPAGADRRRARRPVPPHRDRALGARQQREPGAGEPRAGAGPRGRRSHHRVAAALQRRHHRRLPGPGGHREAGGRGARPAAGRSQREVLSERPTANLAAYDAYLRARSCSSRAAAIRARRRAAVRAYERAVALDTGFVLGVGAALARELGALRQRGRLRRRGRARAGRRPARAGARTGAGRRRCWRWGTTTAT